MVLKRITGPLCLFCAFALAGTSVIAARLVSEKLGSFTIIVTSLFFTVLFLTPLCGRKTVKIVRHLTGREILLSLFQAFCGIFLFRLFLLGGLLHTSTVEAGLLTGATPGITAFLAAILLKEKLNGRKGIGVLCTVGGVLLINNLPLAASAFSTEHFLGNMMVLCAAASESSFAIISRVSATAAEGETKSGMTPMIRTLFVSFAAFVFCLIPALFEDPVFRLAALGRDEWVALIWYGIFVTALAFFFWYAGIERCRAFTAAAFSGVMPFTALLLSVLLLGESAGLLQWAGGGLIAAGMLCLGKEDVTAKKS